MTVLIWGVIFNFYSNLADPNPSSDEWSRLINTEYGFSIEYPTNWHASIYDENGYKGSRETKFRTYRSSIGPAFIRLQYRNASNPILELVENWSRSIAKSQRLQLVAIQFEDLEGKDVLRSAYSDPDYYYEHIGILRENDMVIIIFQVEKEQYENYIETFNHIVGSFKSIK